MKLTTDLLTELKEKAEKAINTESESLREVETLYDELYAAANPETVLLLVEAVREMKEFIDGIIESARSTAMLTPDGYTCTKETATSIFARQLDYKYFGPDAEEK